MTKSHKTYNNLSVLLILIVVTLTLYLFGLLLKEPPQNNDKQNFTNTNNTATSEAHKVDSYAKCVEAGGPVRKTPIPNNCYYDGIVYYEVITNKYGQEHHSSPEELKTYKDCILQEGEAIRSNSSCKSWVGKVFYYDGPPITNYEECMREAVLHLRAGSRLCVAPNGEEFTKPD